MLLGTTTQPDLILLATQELEADLVAGLKVHSVMKMALGNHHNDEHACLIRVHTSTGTDGNYSQSMPSVCDVPQIFASRWLATLNACFLMGLSFDVWSMH